MLTRGETSPQLSFTRLQLGIVGAGCVQPFENRFSTMLEASFMPLRYCVNRHKVLAPSNRVREPKFCSEAASTMSESERETEFLGQILSYDETAHGQRLKTRIAQAQQDKRCVCRALRLPTLLVLLAAVGLGYWEVFLAERVFLPPDSSITIQPIRYYIINGVWGLGLGALFSLLVLLGLVAIYHQRVGGLRKEGRRAAAKLLEDRLRKPATLPLFGVLAGETTNDFLNLLSRNAAVEAPPNSVSPPEPFIQAAVSPDLSKEIQAP
jgi:hypothetical protein